METSGVGGLGSVSELLDVVTVSPKLANSGQQSSEYAVCAVFTICGTRRESADFVRAIPLVVLGR